ncbi:MAG: thioredoxin family protein [Bacteroidia bacterium]|nr:thioredoxin family protein [Bacteroidia bacterium]NNF31889.1 thioredoxin family protein [Flavobacteriaceae bacterium]MBT8277004.1 thioredoxin family protein [Bacteroidia bacterium]NNJ82206.1 thioredoxin family protein [Flavobacteriaceae bacterium]NNK53577.1 thioredoxin family protein [Flavobacteriaceae bacterium]
MALTPSNMLPLGTKAPNFVLIDTITNKPVSLQQVRGEKGTVVMFICNHCPFVKHVNEEIVRLCNDYRVTGFGFVAISSNDVENYPQDSPKKMWENARKHSYPFPYLFDEDQEVAKAYDAACTPDFYLFDHDLKLIYRGQLDNSRPGNNIPVNGRDLREALDNVLNNAPQRKDQKPSIGCNIKWKSN